MSEIPRPTLEIKPVRVANPQEGTEQATNLLLRLVSRNPAHTALFLSGGTTPVDAYRKLAQEERFRPRVVAIVDERIDGSNEQMLRGTGLVDSLERKGARFIGVMKRGVTKREELATYYEAELRLYVHQDKSIKRKVGVIGMGPDGHIAGIASNREEDGEKFENPLFEESMERMVGHFDDEGKYGFNERITLTRRAILDLDDVVIMAFGEEKRKRIQQLIYGPDEDYKTFPGQILRDMARNPRKHVYLFTDQL